MLSRFWLIVIGVIFVGGIVAMMWFSRPKTQPPKGGAKAPASAPVKR